MTIPKPCVPVGVARRRRKALITGHVSTIHKTPVDAARAELKEELGLTENDLLSPLHSFGNYEYREEREDDRLWLNVEVRHLFLARISTLGLGRIRFKDGEVVGLYSLPLGRVAEALRFSGMPWASAAKAGLPRIQPLLSD